MRLMRVGVITLALALGVAGGYYFFRTPKPELAVAAVQPAAVLPAPGDTAAAKAEADPGSPPPQSGATVYSWAVEQPKSVVSPRGPPARDLSTPQLRQAYYNQLLQLTPAELWRQWNALASRKESGEFAWLVTALGYRLRAEPDTEIYHALAARLQESRLALFDRLGVVNALMFAASPEAVEVLIGWMQTNGVEATTDARHPTPEALEMTAAVRRALLEASHTSVNGSRNWALSPPIERAWANADSGASFSSVGFHTLGQMLAYLGRPEGVSVLIDSAARYEPNDLRHQAAMAALAQVSAPDPVAVLGEALRTYRDSDRLTQTLVGTLLSIGSGDAIQEILRYLDFAQTTPEARAATLALLDQASESPAVAKALTHWRSQSGLPSR